MANGLALTGCQVQVHHSVLIQFTNLCKYRDGVAAKHLTQKPQK